MKGMTVIYSVIVFVFIFEVSSGKLLQSGKLPKSTPEVSRNYSLPPHVWETTNYPKLPKSTPVM